MNCASEANPGQTTSKSRFTYSASGPKAFTAEFQTVREFLKDEEEGHERSYDETGAAYMQKLLDELQAKA
jgi:hypothetical protein